MNQTVRFRQHFQQKDHSMSAMHVSLHFTGSVIVFVPDDVPAERARKLADKLALARILATTENTDAPEDDACAEYAEEFGLSEEQAAQDWDGCRDRNLSGVWQLYGSDS